MTETVTVHARFASQVLETPDAVALISDATRTTYTELDQRSNQLARAIAVWVQPGARVGLFCQRSPDTVTAILAVLKLGATFVPFDLGYPRAQLAWMLEDTQPSLILHDASGSELARDLGSTAPCFALETQLAAAQHHAPSALAPAADSGALAYVMFTSGSHGRPKGVMVRHRGILRLVRDQSYAHFGRDEVVLHMAPLAFDASTFELWAPLLHGGAVAILGTARPSLAEIGQIIRSAGVTTAWMTAGLFHAMVDQRLSDLTPLRQLLAGGDVLSAEHVRRALAALPGCRLINGYGPTENTTFTCCYTIPREPMEAASIPIGHPLASTTVYVLDEQLRPVPEGREGQLATGGDGVAAGYLGRPDLTAARFISDPFSDLPGATLYLTGDIVRRRADGALEFLGRRDRQLKIDGKRIELDEIEAALRRVPEVSESAVVLREDARGWKRLIAYVAFADQRSGRAAEPALLACRDALREALPQHMLPSRFVALAQLPLNAQGKLDRKHLPEPELEPIRAVRTDTETERWVAAHWSDVLGAAEIPPDVNMFELGATSIHVVRVHERLAQRYAGLPLLALFEQPSVRALARYLDGVPPSSDPLADVRARAARQAAVHPGRSRGFAIIGMAARIPGAASLAQFWRNVCEGVDSITQFSDSELEDAASGELRTSADYVRARSVLEGIERFDPEFFGMSARDAALTDPQHRVLLECAWEALEDAGYDPVAQPRHGTVGVFAGCSPSTYLLRHVLADRSAVERFTGEYQVGMYSELLGGLTDTLATRVAYKLDLRGPAATVHTACSTSLFAIAQAIQSLALEQCDLALAGGVSITLPQRRGYVHQEGGMVSRDGRCRPFDADASGTVFGSGAGCVLLKRIEDAIRDGDRIYAVVRAAGVTNDGAGKAGFTAPSAEGQASAIVSAHALAEIEPESIGYVETHGTATPLGDPIEFAGLTAAFGPAVAPYCALGSVKANVGHLDAAAGVIGLIKTALCLEHATIPPLAHFRAPNPRLPLAGSAFYLPDSCRQWPEPEREGSPRRAGVSSFGVGGTNVHIVLEEAPSRAPSQPSAAGVRTLLPLSARTPDALARAREALAERLEAEPELALRDVAHTLQRGRRAFDARWVCNAADRNEALAALRAPLAARGAPPELVVFMFPGQGAQFAGMGRGLYEQVPEFRAEIDRAAELLAPLLESDLRTALFAADPEALRDTALAQPALFVLAHALATLWQRLGVVPDVLVGHSVGELVAASLSGALAYEQALRFVARRGLAMRGVPAGGMLAVRAPHDQVSARLPPELELAAVNSPAACVVAGPVPALDAFEAQLRAGGIAHKRLATSHAFHSSLMSPAAGALREAAAELSATAPRLRWVSSVDARPMDAQRLRDPGYFAEQCRATVQFGAALSAAVSGKRALLFEVGPGRALCAFARQQLAANEYAGAVPCLADDGRDALETMYEAAGKAWQHGLALRWTALPSTGRHVSLPTYPFERVSCWIDAPGSNSAPITTPGGSFMTQSTSNASRLPELQRELAAILQNVSGSELAPDELDRNFLELGFDSLALGQVAAQVQRRFAIKVGFRQLLSDYTSCAALAQHLDQTLPAASLPQPPAATAQPPAAAPISAADGLTGLFQAQLRAMSELIEQQNRLLGAGASASTSTSPTAPVPPQPSVPAPEAAPQASRYRQFDPKTASQRRSIDSEQQTFIDDLCRRYVARTRASRDNTATHRPHLADPRAASGFRLEWKELCYPIVAARSKGSKLWDLDGNVYVDLVNGYGQTMFGHAPDFVSAAVSEQLATGFAIGPQSPLAGEVAELISEFTGMQRVTFCNTGSEAVMAALRIARAVTGRDKIAVFANDYHGQFDEVLVRGRTRGTDATALPIAPGIPAGSVANMLVLPYGTDESLAYLRAHMDELAAVVVEPVQSRHPELRPYAFLQQLRAATAAAGTALVFDEVVTGFRVHPGGMQALTGIRADLATYGKVVGGGLPVGILAGSAQFMDALDGGQFRYGDDSFPQVAPTFFAGTFVRHPLVLAACKAVLLHLREAGPSLQEKLAQRTSALVERLNQQLGRKGVSSRLETFSSWFMPSFSSADPLGALFYAHARLLGLHVSDGFPCFLTTAHDDADLEQIERAFVASIDALQAARILSPSAALRASPAQAPLTEMQQEVWLAAQLGDAASCAFNESVCLRFTGSPELAALRAALNDVVARHDALRASFGPTASELRVANTLEVPVPLVALDPHLPPEAALSELIAADARQPFDLAAGPLVRAFASWLAPDQLALVFSAHHIVCDGWSMNVILDELSHCYAARLRGERAVLPEAVSYAQYARELAAAPPSAELEAFWLRRFETVPSLPELPADRARPARRSFSGATYTAAIDAELYRAVKQAGARQGSSLFATLFAAFQVLIGRLAGCDDVVIAVPTAGQSALDSGPLVGHCVHFLPLRAAFDPRAPFAEHLKAVTRQVLDAFDHGVYTLGTLVRKLGLPRDLNRLPLTELQFNLERVGSDLAFPNATVSVAPNPKAYANFDLFLNVIESDAGLRLDCDYNTDLLSEATVARWIGHFRSLLQAIASDASLPIAALPLLSADERSWLLDTLNDTRREPATDAPLHALIAAQAARTPQRIAAEHAGVQLSYAELDARANQLAHHLRRRLGPSPVRVGVALPRSLDLLVALLGVMKAGHAYVPLDPQQPAARSRAVLATARVSALICDDPALGVIAPADAYVLSLTAAAAEIASEPRDALGSHSGGTAYVIFTSGSTGTPKGVEVSQRALLNFLRSMARAPGLDENDTLVAVTTVAFDIAALELYLPLLVGARVVIASSDDVTGGFGLVRLLDAAPGCVLQATPSLYRILLEAKFRPRPGQKLLCGGEAVPRDLADALLASGAELWNMYGPTETTVWSACGRVEPSPQPICVGAPIDHTQLYVLTSSHQLQVPGAPGELFIGGAGLADGYFDRPDLTAAAFLEIALDGRAPERLYRTGDLARRLPDGSLQVLGRVDQQIKLRGFRIEIEEIEAALRTLAGVLGAAVALRPGPSGEPRLVAFYVPERAAKLAPSELAQKLALLLPEYMVPTAWQELSALPLTPNGKLDRKALPESTLESASAPAAREHAPPSTPLELALRDIWREVLGVQEIGVHDSLFSLGADSLQVFRIAARLADRGIPLQAKHLLQHPTIEQAARAASEREAAGKNGHSRAPSLRDFRHGAARRSHSA